jgi:hypothetical protein
MAVEKYDPYTLPTIDLVGGSTQELVFHVYNSVADAAQDLTGCEARFSVVSFINRTSKTVISEDMALSSEDTGSGEVNDLLKVTLTPDKTVDLSGKYIYQITIRYTDKNNVIVDIPWQGIMRVENNIDKAFLTNA